MSSPRYTMQWRLNPAVHMENRAVVLARRALRIYCCQATYASSPHLQDAYRLLPPRIAVLFDPHFLPQVYTSSTTRVTISIVHDSQAVVDTIGPLSIADLKTEGAFSSHGPESVSRYKSFVLWRDNSNPQLLVLSMVKKIPDGDVTKRCYRLVVQVQKDSRSQEYSPTVVYYDSSTLKPSFETRFVMASKTPKEASEKIKRLAAAAATGQPGPKRTPYVTAKKAKLYSKLRGKPNKRAATGARKRSRTQPEPHANKRRVVAVDGKRPVESTQRMSGLVLPATDAAAELVKLLTGQIKTTVVNGPVNTPDTPSAMLGSWPAAVAERGPQHATASHMLSSVVPSEPWQPQLPQQPQPQLQQPPVSHSLQHQSTSNGVSKRQLPHGLSQLASVSPPASTVQLKTGSDGRVTLGL